MNNEIKEILDYLKEFIDEDRLEQINLNRWFVSSLLDYITNLQQENERLKQLDENYPIEEELAEAYRREEDYKSRIEKAIEYIEQNEFYLDYKTGACIKGVMPLLNILNGRSDE